MTVSDFLLFRREFLNKCLMCVSKEFLFRAEGGGNCSIRVGISTDYRLQKYDGHSVISTSLFCV